MELINLCIKTPTQSEFNQAVELAKQYNIGQCASATLNYTYYSQNTWVWLMLAGDMGSNYKHQWLAYSGLTCGQYYPANREFTLESARTHLQQLFPELQTTGITTQGVHSMIVEVIITRREAIPGVSAPKETILVESTTVIASGLMGAAVACGVKHAAALAKVPAEEIFVSAVQKPNAA